MDDTNIFCAGNNLKELQGLINGVLAKLAKWFAVNKLTLNLSKTNYMIFRNRPPDIEINLFINNQQITRVHVTQFLGVYIDESLNWKYQINKVRLKLSKVAAVIYKANCLIGRDGMYILYWSLFLPHLSYCCEIWRNTYTTNIHGITILQKRVIQLVCGVKCLEHTSTLFQQLGVLKFVDLVKLKTAIIMFRAFHNELPSNLQKCLNRMCLYMVLDRTIHSA